MKNKFLEKFSSKTILALAMLVLSLISLAFIGFGWNKYNKLTLTLLATQEELSSTTIALAQKTENLFDAQNQNTDLQIKLGDEVARNNSIYDQVQSLSSTVGLLDKLSKTDRELLQKYSKVYFLSENFVPSSLSDIDTEFLFRKDKPEKIHTNVKPYLENLLKLARADNIPFFVLSGYRSFGTQANLKASYKVTYGAGANKFSADQGYSEHQLGSTVDFTATSTGETLTGFEKTASYKWLMDNAYKFGFILSYPKGNTFYQFEPWHWRFVGVELATKLHDEGKYFYDMDQRVINTYLVKIFD